MDSIPEEKKTVSADEDEEFLKKLEESRLTSFKPSDQPVLTAASRGDVQEVKRLLKQDPELASKRFEWGFTAAHYAGACGQDDMLAFLAGVDPQFLLAQNDYGQTPMHYAAAYGQIRAVKILARKVPQVMDVQSNDGRTSLDMARSGQCRKFLSSEMERRSMERLSLEAPAAPPLKSGCMGCILAALGMSKPPPPPQPARRPASPRRASSSRGPMPSPVTAVAAPPPPPAAATGSSLRMSQESLRGNSAESSRSGSRSGFQASFLNRGKSFDIARVLKGGSSRHFDSQVV